MPLGFAGVAMAAYLQRQGLDVGKIGAFMGAFYLPWAFKWPWAPIVDLIRLDRWGGRKAWIILCQAAMIVTPVAIDALRVLVPVLLIPFLKPSTRVAHVAASSGVKTPATG
jgi:hypothetical protein